MELLCPLRTHSVLWNIMDWVNRPRHTKQFFNHPVFSPLPPPPQNNSSKEIKNELVCIKRKSSLSWRIIPVAVFLITAVVAVVTSHPDTRLPVDTGHGTPQLEPQPSDTTWRVGDFTTEPMCHSFRTINCWVLLCHRHKLIYSQFVQYQKNNEIPKSP